MRRIIKWVILPLFLIFIVLIGYYAVDVYQFLHKIQKPDTIAKGSPPDHLKTTGVTPNSLPPKADFKHRVNILMMGGDSRGSTLKGIQRSDSMIVVSLDPKTKQATLMSVLRDTYVHIPGYGMDRINAAFVDGGPQLSMKTVSELLGIPINYYVYTDFEGFIKLIDTLGGIEMYVPKNMYWTDAADGHRFDINLKQGEQHLDGKTALEYVRFRHDANSDFGRTQRQREFLKALAVKLQSKTAIIKLPMILNNIAPDVVTDIPPGDMFKIAQLAYACKANSTITQQIPPNDLLSETTVKIGNIPSDVLSSDPSKVQAYVKKLFQREDPKTTQKNAG